MLVTALEILSICIICIVLTVTGVSAQDERKPTSMEVEKGYLLSESGEWRTSNPAYEPGGTAPKEFGINYRWGPHKQHITGELVGLGEKGKAIYASLYIMHNPVSGDIDVNLIGWDGTFGPAKEKKIDDKHRIVEALLFQPDGTVKANRHSYELVDPNTYIIRIYEPDTTGEWILQREETWRQLPKKV